MDVGTAAVAISSLLQIMKPEPKSGKTLTQAEINQKLKDEKLNRLFNVKGNMITLMEDMIVEPLLVISEDAMDSKEYDKVGNLLLDIFTSYYIQSFNILQDVYGLDSQTIITILGTDNGYNKLMSSAINKIKQLTSESGLSSSFDDLLSLDNLTTENAKIEDDKKGILGNSLLTRNIMVTMRAFGDDSGNKDMKITMPITIKARLVKVTLESIVQVSEPNKQFNSLTNWLDVKSGMGTIMDYLFQTSAVKKYKAQRLKGNEFLELISKRKLSAYSKIGPTNLIGFELNYTLLLISSNDKVKLDRILNLNIYKEEQKNDFMNSVYSIACAVIDEPAEMVTFLTPKVRGINSVTFREVKGMGNKKDTDIADILTTIFKNKML